MGPSDTRSWKVLSPPLSEWLLEAVSSSFSRMTPVQASTIPLFMGNKDVVVEAVTGSGKTLAFLIPVIEKLLRLDEAVKKHHVGAIIVSPTRELASQIHAVLTSLIAFHPPSAALLNQEDEEEAPGESGSEEKVQHVFSSSVPKIVPQLVLGGTSTPTQDLNDFLRLSPNVLIGTPGRLVTLLSSPRVHAPQSSFEVLVLDEADRLLDLGFKEDLQKILRMLPKQRRTGLFSASVSDAVSSLIRVGLRNPVKVTVRVKSTRGVEARTPASLQLTYHIAPPDRKLVALAKLLSSISPIPQKTIIYVSTCAAVDYFSSILPTIFDLVSTRMHAISPGLVSLHGKMTPKVRTRNFMRFLNAMEPTVLITTDVAARGLDIPTVDLVVQLDAPTTSSSFMHRAGRAGRAGRSGASVIFLSPGREEDYISFLTVRGTPVVKLQDSPVEGVEDGTLDVSDEEKWEMIRAVRDQAYQDRAVYEKAQKAFVSWVRAYAEHDAKSIFRIKDVDWKELAEGWALLRLPRMPEAKAWEGDKNLGLTIDWKEYAFQDKVREKRRREEMELGVEKPNPKAKKFRDSKKEPNSWSKEKEKKQVKEERREKKQDKREKERIANMTEDERRKQTELEGMIKKIRTQPDEETWEGFDG
ncbi:DEAD-domain-containing protein [Eremomyces bilateralis CBS 781.70]|uniref:ATP-dependent RNA helicase n=1 Tax=Eremomyces bilateralis CBS 781.70 TaxID=1392243 RepID=A0A6G1G688_9PEZI|nr:DEAD-domain-containing protein [Eremomyces bilateralis CBS 781.70]KAF1813587.1 DEAD-domain-containing protein [Eremomyces bilateralis CBS 781.70]